MKNLVRDVSHPVVNLAKSATQDAAASFLCMAEKGKYEVTRAVHHRCVVAVPKSKWCVTEKELFDLSWLGRGADMFSVSCYAVAYIMGVHFRAGEWDQYPRCGSVVTCVLDGESYYGRVQQFVRIDGDECPGYASMRWFSKPTYPNGSPLVVRVGEDGSAVLSQYGSIIPITNLDPSRVIVEYSTTPNTYYVMRDSGYDTIK